MKNLIHFLRLAWSVSPAYLILLGLNAVCAATEADK